MDILIIAISSLSCCLLIICIFLLLRVSMLQKKSNDNKDIEKAVKQVKDDILNTLSRQNMEQNTRDRNQREELSRNIQNINKSMGELIQSNNRQIATLNHDIAVKLDMIKDKNIEMSEKQSQKIEKTLEQIRTGNEEKLEQMRKTVDEKLSDTLNKRLDSSFKTVSEQLENVYKALGEMKEMSGGITENVASLNGILKNVKSRGTWAELQLKAILDQTIPTMYVENYSPVPNSLERVEYAIKIPSSDNSGRITYLPVDSKFPMEAYIRLTDATDKGDVTAINIARKELEDEVLKEAKLITKYINVPSTTPFAIMYLASEGLYAEIVSSRSGILERIQHDFNIMISGPMTITALLNSLSMGFKVIAINDKANEVRNILAAVKAQYETFGGLLEKARKKIDEAGRSLDDAQHRNEIIKKKLKSVETIDIDVSNKLLGTSSDDFEEGSL